MKLNCNSVVIVCGGKGSRLSKFGIETPKSLVKIGDIPLIQHQIQNLYSNGFRNFYFLLGFKKDEIKFFLKDS